MARKALKPPIEPLSEQVWQRLEDAVIDRVRSQQFHPTSSLQPRMALLFAAASLVISLLAIATASDRWSPSFAEADGHRSSATASATTTTTTPTSEVRMGHVTVEPPVEDLHDRPLVVSTGNEAMTRELSGSKLTIAPHSSISYRGSDADGWLVVVEDGSVHCDVAPREGRPDFVVHAGTAEVRVVGTQFEVAYREGQAFVSVTEGKVLVLDAGRHTMLQAGQDWPPAKSPQPQPNREEPTNPSSKRTADSARKSFELAARLESSDPARALNIYRELSRSGGPWAANALYAQARLSMESGQDAEARRLLSRYLKRYPRGTNAADARRLLEHHSSHN